MSRSTEDILLEIAQLQARLDEAQQLLRDLGPGLAELSEMCRQAGGSSSGEPDVPGRIPEAAAIVAGSGRILRCSGPLARMLHVPPGHLLGSSLYHHVASQDEGVLASLLERGSQVRTNGSIHLSDGDGRHRKVRITVQPAGIAGLPGACVVLTGKGGGRRVEGSHQAGGRHHRAVVAIAEGEQQRIGKDLQDELGQTLAAIALLGRTLYQRLQTLGSQEAGEVEQIVGLVNQGLRQLHNLAASLQAVGPGPDGLRKALGEYAADIASLHDIVCRFEWDGRVQVGDQEVATHLYRIAQEAVRHAVGHGKATWISIRLAGVDGNGGIGLNIASDGIDFPAETGKRGSGLRIMNQRARAIGASLWARRNPAGGGHVTCSVPGSMGVAEVKSRYDNATGSDQ